MYSCFAVCPTGLEMPLVDELKTLGLGSVVAGRAGAHFVSDWPGVLRANLCSRIASRVLLQVVKRGYYDTGDLYELSYSVPWHEWFDGPNALLRLDISSHRSPLTSLRHALLRCKDAVCDRYVAEGYERPNIDTHQPTVRLHIFLTHNEATLYIDTSGESLFKRGWRVSKQTAPIKENLAAGLLCLADWRPGIALHDPFCGSGTIAIEAACRAAKLPPGIGRRFGFENLHLHSQAAWQSVREAACAQINTMDAQAAPIIGSDIDADALQIAAHNLAQAQQQLSATGARGQLSVMWQHCDVRATKAAVSVSESMPGMLVTNPPYGHRLHTEEDPQQLFREWSSVLKREFGGWRMAAISADPAFPKQLRLQPKQKIPLFNGDTECRLFKFELVAGGYRKPNHIAAPQDSSAD